MTREAGCILMLSMITLSCPLAAEIVLIEQDSFAIATQVAIAGSGDFVVIYTEANENGYLHYDLYSQEFSAKTNVPLGPPLRVNELFEFNDNYFMDVDINDEGDYVVAWRNGRPGLPMPDRVALRVIGASRNPLGSEVAEEPFGQPVRDVDVSIAGTGFVVAWSGIFPGRFQLSRYRFDAAGETVTRVGETVKVADLERLTPNNGTDVVLSGERIFAVYKPIFYLDSHLYLKIYDFDSGALLVGPVQLWNFPDQHSDIQIARGEAGEIVVSALVYQEDDEFGLRRGHLLAQRLNALGVPIGEPIQFSKERANILTNASILPSDLDNFSIVWGQDLPQADPNADPLLPVYCRRYSDGALADLVRLDRGDLIAQFPRADQNARGESVQVWSAVTSFDQNPDGSFPIEVYATFDCEPPGPKTPEEAIEELIIIVIAFELSPGIENSLVTKLRKALRSLTEGRGGAACHQLRAFSNQVEALSGGKLPTEDADALLISVSDIQSDLDCRPASAHLRRHGGRGHDRAGATGYHAHHGAWLARYFGTTAEP